MGSDAVSARVGRGAVSARVGRGAVSARVGMVGAGQLARMTQQAAVDLAVELHVLGAGSDEPAATAGARLTVGSPDDPAALTALAEQVDVVTLDHELVPGDALRALLAAGHPVHPHPDALAYGQDKAHARRRLAERGFPVPAFAVTTSRAGVLAFAERAGWPVVVKHARGGYDGRGVTVAAGPDQVPPAEPGLEFVVEELVPLAMEVAVVSVRSPSGALVQYPVVETVQDDGICRELVMPARLDPVVAAQAAELAADIVTAIDAVGVVAVELFVTTDGRVLVNELALRPHNSGHATIEGCITSQFHNHLRAVLDWPLGDPGMRAPAAAMVNVLGGTDPVLAADAVPAALAVADAAVHLYGKQSRPGRKIGHVTVLDDDPTAALTSARRAATALVTP